MWVGVLPGERYNPHSLDLEIILLPPSRSKHTSSQETELKKKKKKKKIQTLQHPLRLSSAALIPAAKAHDDLCRTDTLSKRCFPNVRRCLLSTYCAPDPWG